MPQRRQCRQCDRLARDDSRFCSAACERIDIRESEREPNRESVEIQEENEGRVWCGHRRLNLQNSA